MSDGKRAFMMGNALVVGVVERIADELITRDGRRRARGPSSQTQRSPRPRTPWPGLQLPNPPPSSPAVRNVMRANRARDTGPELRLRRALREAGLGGYRLNWKKAPGRPDIAYPGRKVAIFVHGCYWHHCPRCYPNLPKSNPEFWARKFELNRERDARKRATSEDVGLVRRSKLGSATCEIASVPLSIRSRSLQRAVHSQDTYQELVVEPERLLRYIKAARRLIPIGSIPAVRPDVDERRLGRWRH